jgi:mRNA interferase MazF
MKRGEIYWVDFNPTIGSEISKIRPALIVSNDINNQYADTVSVLPITSTTSKVYPYEVLILPTESGLENVSKIKANQIRTIDKQRLKGFIGKLSTYKMYEVDDAILIHLAIVK